MPHRFTPSAEIELCGHATLAAAHALYETGRVAPFQLIHFETKYSGVLTALGRPDGNIELNFPATPVSPIEDLPYEHREALKTALFLVDEEILFVGSSQYDMVVEITRTAFARLATFAINFTLLTELGHRGVLITTQGGARAQPLDLLNVGTPPKGRAPRADVVNDSRFDFVSRCFFPR